MNEEPIAFFSPDTNGPDGRGAYRFTLWRRGLQDNFLFMPSMNSGRTIRRERATQVCNFVCLNPSTADERLDDPTIRRCWGFAQLWGFDAFVMTNAFAFRATDPEVMKRAEAPTGDPLNEAIILQVAERAGMVVLGWGKHAMHLQRAAQLEALLRPLREKVFCLRKNADGSPQHPLYLPANSQPMPYFNE